MSESNEKIMVIAGDVNEYQAWKRGANDLIEDSCYVIDEQSLVGLSRDATVVLVVGKGALKSCLVEHAEQMGFEVRVAGG